MTMLDYLTSPRSLRLPALEPSSLGRWPRTLPFSFTDLQSTWPQYLSCYPIQVAYTSWFCIDWCLLQYHEEPLPEHGGVHWRCCWWAQIKAGSQLEPLKSLPKLWCFPARRFRTVFIMSPFSFPVPPPWMKQAWARRTSAGCSSMPNHYHYRCHYQLEIAVDFRDYGNSSTWLSDTFEIKGRPLEWFLVVSSSVPDFVLAIGFLLLVNLERPVTGFYRAKHWNWFVTPFLTCSCRLHL